MPAMIADNVRSVRQRIAACCEKCGRTTDGVQLVSVTKTACVEEMREAIAAGVRAFGENRVLDAAAKHRLLADNAEWHLIGHLQTNKVRDAVGIFSLIHSVDSIKLAQAIDREASKIGKRQDVLIQVSTSGEESKFGLASDESIEFIHKIASFSNINIKGLMTIAPAVSDPETVRPYFRALRELLVKVNAVLSTKYGILSMGMTDDFEVAIEEGSNIVRIGRAIFSDKK